MSVVLLEISILIFYLPFFVHLHFNYVFITNIYQALDCGFNIFTTLLSLKITTTQRNAILIQSICEALSIQSYVKGTF